MICLYYGQSALIYVCFHLYLYNCNVCSSSLKLLKKHDQSILATDALHFLGRAKYSFSNATERLFPLEYQTIAALQNGR